MHKGSRDEKFERYWPGHYVLDDKKVDEHGDFKLRFGEKSVISPMILPFNTQLRIEVQIGRDNCLTLQGRVCRCNKVDGGWQAEVFLSCI